MLTGIEIKTINHLGIVAGIIDELKIVELINQELGIDEQEIVNERGNCHDSRVPLRLP